MEDTPAYDLDSHLSAWDNGSSLLGSEFHVLFFHGNELMPPDILRISSESMTVTMQQSPFHALYMLHFPSCLIYSSHRTTRLLAKLAQSPSE
jgi:hypothetical protein